MKEAQRIIKYFAIALGVFLIFNILLMLFYGLSSISSVFDEDKKIINELSNLDVESASILSVDVSTVNLYIKTGDVLDVQSDNDNVEVSRIDNKVYVVEKKVDFFKLNKTYKIVITVPNTMVFDGVAIETGISKLDIEYLKTDNLYLDLGVGSANIGNVVVNRKATIDSGVGELTLKTGVINNLDMDIGVGGVSLNAQLLGDNRIDTGVGNVDIDLIGSIDNYEITLERGVGKINIDGKSVDDGIYGNGLNKIDIDGGVGSLDISLNN